MRDKTFNTQKGFNMNNKEKIKQALAKIQGGSERQILLYIAVELFDLKFYKQPEQTLQNVEILFPQNNRKLGEFKK